MWARSLKAIVLLVPSVICQPDGALDVKQAVHIRLRCGVLPGVEHPRPRIAGVAGVASYVQARVYRRAIAIGQRPGLGDPVIEVDVPSRTIVGHVIGIRDELVFQGNTAEEAVAGFHRTVDYYLARLAEEGQEPERPFSGRFNRAHRLGDAPGAGSRRRGAANQPERCGEAGLRCVSVTGRRGGRRRAFGAVPQGRKGGEGAEDDYERDRRACVGEAP